MLIENNGAVPQTQNHGEENQQTIRQSLEGHLNSTTTAKACVLTRCHCHCTELMIIGGSLELPRRFNYRFSACC